MGNYTTQYIEDCDYVRSYFDLKPEVSIQELFVKLTAEFKKLSITTSSEFAGEPVTSSDATELKLEKPKCQKKSKKLSKSQRLKKLKKRHSTRKVSEKMS